MLREARGFIVGVFIGLMALPCWAVFTSAMTTDQLGGHLIRLINRGFSQEIYGLDEKENFENLILKAGPDYVVNGAFDTQANRVIAIRDIERLFWQQQTGKDPTSGLVSNGSSDRHQYIRHFLESKLGVSTSTVNTVEGEN